MCLIKACGPTGECALGAPLRAERQVGLFLHVPSFPWGTQSPCAVLDSGRVAGGCKAGRHSSGELAACPWSSTLRSQALPQATLSRVCRSVLEYEKVIVLRQSKRESRFRVLATVSPRFPGNVKLFGWGSVVLRPRHQDRGSPVGREGLSSIVGLSAPCPVPWSVKVFRNKLRYSGTFLNGFI